MPTDNDTIQVALFSTRQHADRAQAELLAEGYTDEGLGQIWSGDGQPCGRGTLGYGVGSEVATHLAKLGVSPEAADYYGREVVGGRCLLLILGLTPQARVAIGRHCGAIRVPPQD